MLEIIKKPKINFIGNRKKGFIISTALVVFALFFQQMELIHLLLGTAAGSATGLAIHVMHHISEENEKNNEK